MGHFIPLEQAIQMTTQYRENKEKLLTEEFQNKGILCNAETFDRAAFDAVLARQGCEKLRVYYGMDAASKVHAIIVGVNADNQDILPAAPPATVTEDTTASEAGAEPTTGEDTGIIESGVRCPPDCDTPSPLNP